MDFKRTCLPTGEGLASGLPRRAAAYLAALVIASGEVFCYVVLHQWDLPPPSGLQNAFGTTSFQKSGGKTETAARLYFPERKGGGLSSLRHPFHQLPSFI